MKSENEVAQSCPTLRDSLDCSPPGSSVHGIFQARVLEWGAIAFSNAISFFYCSLQHWTLLPSPVTSTAGHCFHFGSVSSFFLELFLCFSPVAQWTSTKMVDSSSGIIFLPFHPVHGVLTERILVWFVIPFSSGPHFVRTLHHDPSVLDSPTWHVS